MKRIASIRAMGAYFWVMLGVLLFLHSNEGRTSNDDVERTTHIPVAPKDAKTKKEESNRGRFWHRKEDLYNLTFLA